MYDGAGEDQVRGFHVAVHDTALVREVQRQQQLRHDGGDLSEIEARLPVEVFAQARAFDVLHRDERVECVLAVFINADDVRMQQPSGRLRLVLEARHHLHGKIGIDEILAYGLDRDDALDVRIEGLVHDPHRALAEHALDQVFADFFRFSHANSARPLFTKQSGCAVVFQMTPPMPRAS